MTTLLVMGGEGIGPEITREGVKLVRAVAERFGLSVTLRELTVGKPALQQWGEAFPAEARAVCDAASQSSDAAILFGAVSLEPIATLRKRYDLFANLRPIRAWPSLLGISRLKPEVVRDMDLLVVRELVSGVYYGKQREGSDERGRFAGQEAYYHETEVRRIARVALAEAQRRKKHLTYVHKTNAIRPVFQLWASVLEEERRAFSAVRVDEMLVDNMAMQLVLRPADFDVLLCSNMFGDILSDLGAGLVGSIGLLPSASLNASGFALYESVGGTAPDLAGRDVANPVSTLLSVALWARHTLRREDVAAAIEAAVARVLATHRTVDLAEPGVTVVGTAKLGDLVVEALGRAS